MSKKVLYLECFSGISGDMTVGALLDLGADPEVLKQSLDSLHVEGYEVKIGRSSKCGIDACDFDVLIPDQPEYDEGHMHHHHDEDHDHEHEHHHHDEHDHEHEHHHHDEDHEHEHHHHDEHDHEHEHHHHDEHDHEHEHHHDEQDHEHHHHHDHEHGHHHPHVHRNIHDVFAVIDRLENEHVKELAKKMFMIVAEAESKAHGLPIEEVHFHEVGAIDSIVDIISVAVCVDNLGVDDIVVSELYEGSGHVHCQHGMMPVPVPATANIVAANHLPMKITDAQGEMVTPTGAAIAAALRTQERLPEDYQLLKIGLGAGKKDFPKANVLRAMLLETKEQEQTGTEEDIWKLESNIDDCSGEVLGYTMDRLLAAGARDVCYAPIYLKKNRPAYMLHVLCDRSQIAAMEEIIFNETTTIGIRRYKVERTILKRHEAKAKTAYGEVELKICEKNGTVYRYPEYESVKKLCEAAGVPFKVVYQAACEAEID